MMILAHITPADASTPPADTDPPVTPATRLPFFRPALPHLGAEV
jgi:hypothetical protein